MLKEDNNEDIESRIMDSKYSNESPVVLNYAQYRISKTEKIIVVATIIGGLIVLGGVFGKAVCDYARCASESYFTKRIHLENVFP